MLSACSESPIREQKKKEGNGTHENLKKEMKTEQGKGKGRHGREGTTRAEKLEMNKDKGK